MNGMKPKDAIKLDNVKQDIPEKYPKGQVLLEDGLYRYLYQPGEQHVDKKHKLFTLSGVKICIDQAKLQKIKVIEFVLLADWTW